MVRTEDVNVGDTLRQIHQPHVYGVVERLGVLGIPNFFKLKLPDGRCTIIQKPEEWEHCKQQSKKTILNR